MHACLTGGRILVGPSRGWMQADAARDAKAAASMGGKKKKGHKASESGESALCME